MKRLSLVTILALMLGVSSFTAFAQGADTVVPSDVNQLEGEAIDGGATLRWSAATDNVGVTGYVVYYGTESVTTQGSEYEFNEDAGNVLEHTIQGLTNGTTYYFSVIAYDVAGNESASWAPELTIVPSAGGNTAIDTTSPQVLSAEAVSSEEVSIVFSEEIVLPTDSPEIAFMIEDQNVFEPLLVLEAKLDENDNTKKTVILLTEKQTLNTEYKLTVQLDVTDKAGNPIVSGTSDTAMFTGSDIPMQSHETDSVAPQLLSLEVLSAQNIYIQFDEEIVLNLNPIENFEIVNNSDATKKLTILAVELGKNDEGLDNASVLITTDAQEEVEYMFKAIDVKDMAGNKIDTADSNRTFMGLLGDTVTPPDDNTTPPDDNTTPPDNNTPAAEKVADFIASKVFNATKYDVNLTWKILDSSIAAQNLYMKMTSGADFDLEASLNSETDSYTVEGLEAGDYWFKLTTVDAEGNESVGVETNIKLAETGPEVLGLVFLSVGLSGLIRKKEKIEKN